MTITADALRPDWESRAEREAPAVDPAEPPFVFRRPQPGLARLVYTVRRGDHLLRNGDWVLVTQVKRLVDGGVLIVTCASALPGARVEERFHDGREQVRVCRPAEWVPHIAAEMADVTSALQRRR